MSKFEESEELEIFLQSNYDICRGRKGDCLHEFEKNFWNQQGKYWFRKCKHCGERERWRTILSDGYVTDYNRETEMKIIARNRKGD